MIALLALAASLAAAPACPADPPVLPKVVQQTGHAGAVLAAAWASDARVVSLGTDGRLLFWDARAGRLIDRIAVPLPPVPAGLGATIWGERSARLTLSPDRRYAAVTVESVAPGWETLPPNTVIVDLVRHIALPPVRARPWAWLAGPRLLVSGDAGAAVIDPAAGAQTALPAEASNPVLAVASVDGSRFAMVTSSGGASRRLSVRRASDFSEVAHFALGAATFAVTGFDRAGGRVFVRDESDRLKVFSLTGVAPETRHLAAILASPGDGRAVREFTWTDFDAGTVAVGDWRPNPDSASDIACDCATRVLDFRTGAPRGHAAGEAVAPDGLGGVIVVVRRLFGGATPGLSWATPRGSTRRAGPSARWAVWSSHPWPFRPTGGGSWRSAL